MRVVPAYGPKPSHVLIVGESPGRAEARLRRPFVGPSGEEQRVYMLINGLDVKLCRLTNVVCVHTPGNPDPTPKQTAYWTPYLKQEIAECNPSVIFAVGRYSARWFLGDSVSMSMVHGVPHRGGEFDRTRKDRAQGAIVVPVTHPAMGLHQFNARSMIAWDYEQAVNVYNKVLGGCDIWTPKDEYSGKERYESVTGEYLSDFLSMESPDVISIDTEGTSRNPYTCELLSIQVTIRSGMGLMVWRTDEHFDQLIGELQYRADTGALFVLHNAMYDFPMCRRAGLDLSQASIYDSMYAAYLLGHEPQGLKPLQWRMCGMESDSYEETVGGYGRDRQISYLAQVASLEFRKPDKVDVRLNNGSVKQYGPQSPTKKAERILKDCIENKCYKDGNLIDPFKRWHTDSGECSMKKTALSTLRDEVTEICGPMPVANLSHIPLDIATKYACRDSDATYRTYWEVDYDLQRSGLGGLMKDGMSTLPMFESMQQCGMPVDRVYFEELHDEFVSRAREHQRAISLEFMNGQPFNPNSREQTVKLLELRGLEGLKRTPSGEVSTAEDSIGHLQWKDKAIWNLFQYRKLMHLADNNCKPIINLPRGQDFVYYNLQITRTATRRPASRRARSDVQKVNILNIPSRTEEGLRIRAGYRCKEGLKFVKSDLIQIEMKVMAHLSGDETLCEYFNSGKDIHKETAARVFNVKNVTQLQRGLAKSVNFGIIYLITGSGLHADIRKLEGVDFDEWDIGSCQSLIDNVLDTYPGVRQYHADVERDLISNRGYVRDYWNMPRYLPGIFSSDRSVRAESIRKAVSHLIQGMAQGIIQKSMAYLWPMVLGLQQSGVYVRPALQVYDELIFIVEDRYTEVLSVLLVDALTNHCGVELSVPVEADSSIGSRWSELK